MTRWRAKRYILSCKHALLICYNCKRVINILFFTHALPRAPRSNVPQDILSCTHALLIYLMCERAIRYILYFTHALRLYNLWQTLLTSNPIWWYRQHAVCTWILYRTIFCTILHISASSLRISYGKYPPITSSTTAVITTYTQISASLWTSLGPFPWWRCMNFSEECGPWWVWYHCLCHNDVWRSDI